MHSPLGGQLLQEVPEATVGEAIQEAGYAELAAQI